MGRHPGLNFFLDKIDSNFKFVLGRLKAFGSKSQVAKDTVLDVLGSVLEYLAGGPEGVCAMLLAFLDRPTNSDLRIKVRDGIGMEGTVVAKVAEAYRNSSSDRDRRMFAQLVSNKPRNYLRKNGFECLGRALYKTTKTEVQNSGSLGPRDFPQAYQKPSTRKRKAPQEQEAFKELWWEFSEEASSHHAHCHDATIQNEPVRFLTESITHVGHVAEERGLGCRNTAIAYLRENLPYIIEPTVYTDYCKYCDDLREKIKECPPMLAGLKKRLGMESSTEKDLRTFFKTHMEKINEVDRLEISKHLREIWVLQEHKRNAARQKRAFEDSIKDPNKLTILFDYKQKIEVGRGPVNRDNAFWDKSSCTMLGFQVFVGEVQLSVDCVSNSVAETGPVTVLNIDKLLDELSTNSLTKELVKKGKLTQVDFWCDCGPHFRNAIVAWYVLYNVARWQQVETRRNFFVEKHGKGRCDAHFRWVNGHLDQYCKSDYLYSASDVKIALEAMNSKVNSDRKRKKHRPSNLWVLEYDCEEFLPELNRLMEWRLVGITDTYCLSRTPDPTGKVAADIPVLNHYFSDLVEGEVMNVKPTTQSTATVSTDRHRKVKLPASSNIVKLFPWMFTRNNMEIYAYFRKFNFGGRGGSKFPILRELLKTRVVNKIAQCPVVNACQFLICF